MQFHLNVHSHRQIISAFRSSYHLAKVLGTTPEHVRIMKIRDSIPPGPGGAYWLKLTNEAKRTGMPWITLDLLLRTRKRKRRKGQ